MDFSMAFHAITEGNAARLFVRQGYIQPGVIDFDQKIVTVHDTVSASEVTDDVVDTFIELVMHATGWRDLLFICRTTRNRSSAWFADKILIDSEK